MAMVSDVPRFCVLGGGIAGLVSARLLQRQLPHAQITVLEESERLGGLVQTARGPKGQILEQGFHSSILVNRNGREALGLAKMLKLNDEVLGANIEASARRHLLHRGRVQIAPAPHHVLFYGPALMAEPLWPRGRQSDESVAAFTSRRGSRSLARHLADPICRGQLAGKAEDLSVRTCFPRLWHNEQRFGSVFVGAALGALSSYRQRSWMALDLLDPLLQRVATGGRSYSFRNGLSSLTDTLEESLQRPAPGTRPAEIRLGSAVQRLEDPGDNSKIVHVCLGDGSRVDADCVIAAIPPHTLGGLLQRSLKAGSSPDDTVWRPLTGIQHKSVAVVNVCFDKDVLKERRLRGAGYFIGSYENQGSMLAMSWDSQLFPEQGASGSQMTLYFDGDLAQETGPGFSEEAVAESALEAVKQHLGIQEQPSHVSVKLWQDALPQYRVGHHMLLQDFNAARRRHLPWLQVCGPGYFGTRNVADEVVDARELTDTIVRRFMRFPHLIENELEEDTSRRSGRI
ncbi:PPOX [Symbiodinium sp. CCMP2592]|nr:PPOX [Symbiodinium sp. CCMP2592]